MSRLVHVVNLFGDTPRHKRAQATWDYVYAQGVKPVHVVDFPRDATKIGDPRKLPYLKDMLERGLQNAKGDQDVIIWTNDDVGFETGIVEWARDGIVANGAMSMRRNESGHIGRDLFAFTSKWLRDNFDKIPDYIQGAPCFDLALAAQIRKHYGIFSTLENLHLDIWPAESLHRYATHEAHPSEWAGAMENVYKANLWNKKLANEWFAKNNPAIRL
jgi:hypothetical protein